MGDVIVPVSSNVTNKRRRQEDSRFTKPEHPIHNERHLRIICVGAGASGLLFAYKLQRNFSNFDLVIYEKNEEVGGTWWENKYPGYEPESSLFIFRELLLLTRAVRIAIDALAMFLHTTILGPSSQSWTGPVHMRVAEKSSTISTLFPVSTAFDSTVACAIRSSMLYGTTRRTDTM